MKKEEVDQLRPTIKQALEKGAHYCAYQERCQQEVRTKLYKLKLDRDDVEEVIYLLIKGDFLNEERFAKAYCRGKFRQNKWGRNKIIQNLKQKNISKRNIDLGLTEIDEVEYINVLEQLLSKKRDSLKDKNQWVRKNKITQHLTQKGFEYELIAEFL